MTKNRLLNLIAIVFVVLVSSCSKNSRDNNSYDLIAVEVDGKWGYIDKNGKYSINPQFKQAFLFADGLALVQSPDDKYGYIGEDGKYIINPTYKSATAFSENLAFVTIENGFPTCIDKKGEIKFELREVSEAGSFHEGMAAVKIKDKWGFIDMNGKVVINPQFDEVKQFKEGLASVAVKKDKEKDDLNWGYIDKDGKIVINHQFNKAHSFESGKALVNDGKKYGYIDVNGLYVVNPQFDEAMWFSEGIAAIRQGDLWGFINEEGKVIINPQFESCTSFLNGLAAVRSGKENWGYIDKDGKYAVNPQFKSAAKFHSDFTPVQSGDKFGFIDKAGKFVINPQFNNVNISSESFKLDSWPLQYEFVFSDYFDVGEIANIIIEKGSKGDFDHINSKTTLGQILDMPINKDKLKENNRYSIINTNKEDLNADVAIVKVEYGFKDPIYNNVNSYYYGFSTGSEKKYDYNATIEYISYSLNLSNYGKGDKKAHLFAAEIQNKLLKKYLGSDKIETASVTTREELEKQAKLVADSISAALSASLETALAEDANTKVKSDYKTLHVYSSVFNFEIISDGINDVTLTVYFKNKSNL